MTLPIPSSNGGHQRQRDGASKSDTANKACTHCKICHSSSHIKAECPFLTFLGLRRGIMTFQLQLNVVDQPFFNDPFPRPGDSPVHRPPVPLIPRALRHVDSAIPLLVQPHIESPHVSPSHSSRPDSHPTDGTKGARSKTESTKETGASNGNNDENQSEG